MSLVEKYNISEKDAYTLAEIEILKEKEGLFSLKKEKLKAKSMQVLKPYKVKFMDLGNLINEIKKNPHFNSPELKEKYGKIESNDIKSDYSWAYRILIGFLVVVGIIIFSNYNNKLNPENILGKDWFGKNSYSALGNAYRAELKLSVTKEGDGENAKYRYQIFRDVYENGYFVKSYEFSGYFLPETVNYQHTVAGTKYSETIWMTDNPRFGLILNHGDPVHIDPFDESKTEKIVELRDFVGEACITLR
ncbi:MAG: hypothetical protein FJX95_06640 [Bacteroidetes bacterium]|nr:hypothetical protein [Bacteroidota bacterium]